MAAKFQHKIVTTEQVSVEGIVNQDGTITIQEKEGEFVKNVLDVIIDNFVGQNVKLSIAKKTEQEVIDEDNSDEDDD